MKDMEECVQQRLQRKLQCFGLYTFFLSSCVKTVDEPPEEFGAARSYFERLIKTSEIWLSTYFEKPWRGVETWLSVLIMLV